MGFRRKTLDILDFRTAVARAPDIPSEYRLAASPWGLKSSCRTARPDVRGTRHTVRRPANMLPTQQSGRIGPTYPTRGTRCGLDDLAAIIGHYGSVWRF